MTVLTPSVPRDFAALATAYDGRVEHMVKFRNHFELNVYPMATVQLMQGIPQDMILNQPVMPDEALKDKQGWDRARAAIVQYYTSRYDGFYARNLPIGPENVLLTENATRALDYAFTTMRVIGFEKNRRQSGEENDINSPAFMVAPQFRWSGIDFIAAVKNIKILEVPQDRETGAWDLDFLRSLDGRKDIIGVYRASPGVSDGAIATREETAAVAAWCASNKILFVEDLVKERFTGFKDVQLPLLSQHYNNGMVVANTSYMWAANLWNTGWVIGPRQLLAVMMHFVEKPVVAVKQQTIPVAVAMPDVYYRQRRESQAKRNKALIGVLTAAELPVVRSEAGLAVVVDISQFIGKPRIGDPKQTIRDAIGFCSDLGLVTGVMASPCSAQNGVYVRFAANSLKVISGAGEKIKLYTDCHKYPDLSATIASFNKQQEKKPGGAQRTLPSGVFFHHPPEAGDRPPRMLWQNHPLPRLMRNRGERAL